MLLNNLVTLGKLLNLSELCFPPLSSDVITVRAAPGGLPRRLNRLFKCVKLLADAQNAFGSQ